MCQGSISPKAIHSDHADCHDDNFDDDDFDDEEKGYERFILMNCQFVSQESSESVNQQEHQNIRKNSSKAVKKDLGEDHVGRVGEGEDKGKESEAEHVAPPEKGNSEL